LAFGRVYGESDANRGDVGLFLQIAIVKDLNPTFCTSSSRNT